ncbi:hypothetical protein F5B18DRAFT_655648 [Nemania serpens]|nr:hypothetical protein F5B18DRAFT_655648 [Nemania serpens]
MYHWTDVNARAQQFSDMTAPYYQAHSDTESSASPSRAQVDLDLPSSAYAGYPLTDDDDGYFVRPRPPSPMDDWYIDATFGLDEHCMQLSVDGTLYEPRLSVMPWDHEMMPEEPTLPPMEPANHTSSQSTYILSPVIAQAHPPTTNIDEEPDYLLDEEVSGDPTKLVVPPSITWVARHPDVGIMIVMADHSHLGVMSAVINEKGPKTHHGLLVQHARQNTSEQASSMPI